MATYRPIKKIAIPVIALLLGFGFAFIFVPTKMDAVWKDWNKQMNKWEQYSYSLSSVYTKDGEEASKASGNWSNGQVYLTLAANVSDDTVFAFDIYIEDDRLFIHSGEDWRQGSTNDRFTSEIAPLDHPFEWMRDMLAEADYLKKVKKENRVTYEAVFEQFDEVDFRGYSLEKQQDTTLTLTVENGTPQSLMFHVTPIRPDYIGPFDGYPKEIYYQLTFEEMNEPVKQPPAQAYESKGLDE